MEALPHDGNLNADVVFSSAGGSSSRAHAWRWSEQGAVVIDNTSAWHLDERCPLVIPEINGEAALAHRGVIANPNCSTIVALMALAPLHRAFGLKRATIATYQGGFGFGGGRNRRARSAGAGLPQRRGRRAGHVPAPHRLQPFQPR